MSLATTANNALCYSTTENHNLDLFYQMERNININNLNNLLENSFNLDKKKTIAIIFNSRDRIKGKKEKKVSNYALIWLKNNYNDIYKNNIETYINKYGCWKDVCFIIEKCKKNNFEYKLISNRLNQDLKIIEHGEDHISLCSKWVFNANTKESNKLCKYLFDKSEIKKDERYRKEYLKPLRTKLNLIESKICTKNWDEIDYAKIPASAIKKYNKIFIKNDSERYNNFLENSTTKIKITGLLPHEIISNYIKNSFVYNELLELQWNAFINQFKENDNLKNIIPIVDVSGSMYNGTNIVKPVTVALALGLLISNINTGFLHKKVITFSCEPTFFTIVGDTLCEQLNSITKMNFGLNTNFLKIADLLISNNYILGNYKKIICLSDMQFDENCDDDKHTSHNNFIEKFTNYNLECPQIIYWNINSNYNNFPINTSIENVAILSGFSEQLLNTVFESDNFNSLDIMENILKPYYNFINI
jgi:hypothetical protein